MSVDLKETRITAKNLLAITILGILVLVPLTTSSSESVLGDDVSNPNSLADVGSENLDCEVKSNETEADNEYDGVKSPSCSDNQFLLIGRCIESNAGDSALLRAGIKLDNNDPYGAQWKCRWRELDTGDDPSKIRSKGVCCEHTGDLNSVDLDCTIKERTNTEDKNLRSVKSPSCPSDKFLLSGFCHEKQAGGSSLLRFGTGKDVSDPYGAQWRCKWNKLNLDSEITSKGVCCKHIG